MHFLFCETADVYFLCDYKLALFMQKNFTKKF